MKLATLEVGPLGVNCYLLMDDTARQATIVDPGEEPGHILDTLARKDLEPTAILATHGHFDHIGGVGHIKREFDIPFHIHSHDLFFVKDCQAAAARWGFEIEQAPLPDGYLEHGQSITVGTSQLEVRHIPGHSPGGVALYCEKEGFVLSGDTLSRRSVGRTDFRKGDLAQMKVSIRKQLYTLPDETQVLSGHGPPTTIGEEKRENPWVPERDRRWLV